MKQTVLVILFLSLSQIAQAFTYINWGAAFDYPGPYQYSDVQIYSLGQSEKLNKTFNLFGEAGGWKDQGHYKGALPGIFMSVGLSLDLQLRDHYVAYSLGPAYIIPKDTLLGSPFQVYQKISLGVRQDNKRIGLFLKHFSNAGLSKINYGRNWVGVEIGF